MRACVCVCLCVCVCVFKKKFKEAFAVCSKLRAIQFKNLDCLFVQSEDRFCIILIVVVFKSETANKLGIKETSVIILTQSC